MNREPLVIATLALRTSELAIARGRPRQGSRRGTTKGWSEGTIPIELVFTAATPSVIAFAWWLLSVLIAAALAYLVLAPLGWFAPRSIDGYFYAFCVIGTLSLVLGRPSALGLPDVSGVALEAERMRWPDSEELSDSERVTAQFFVDLAAVAAQRRVVALWWVTGATWALSAYLVQKGFEGKDGSLLSYAVGPTLVSVMIAGLTAAYARSVNHVYALAHALLRARVMAAPASAAGRRRVRSRPRPSR